MKLFLFSLLVVATLSIPVSSSAEMSCLGWYEVCEEMCGGDFTVWLMDQEGNGEVSCEYLGGANDPQCSDHNIYSYGSCTAYSSFPFND
jgi:hypothetical protein